jgi:hypothetical protein
MLHVAYMLQQLNDLEHVNVEFPIPTTKSSMTSKENKKLFSL